MSKKLDVVYVNADSSAAAYQGLADKYAAIEPPTWSLLLANSARAVGFSVALVDSTAERLSHVDTVQRIMDLDPRLVVFVVYGEQFCLINVLDVEVTDGCANTTPFLRTVVVFVVVPLPGELTF